MSVLMNPEEVSVRRAAIDCLKYWIRPSHSINQNPPKALHAESSSVLNVGPGNDYTYSIMNGKNCRFVTSKDNCQVKVISVEILPVPVQQTVKRYNKHQIIHHNHSTVGIVHASLGNNVVGWMTMLKINKYWQCISAAFSPLSIPYPHPSIDTTDLHDIAKLCWDGYRTANRNCDGQAMTQFFHPTCRLTSVDTLTTTTIKEDGSAGKSTTKDILFIKNREEFCDMVTNRYNQDDNSGNNNNNLHAAFTHVHDHVNVGCFDTLLSIKFALPKLAIVTLKVGHPPYLWTDVLTVAKLQEKKKKKEEEKTSNEEGADDDAQEAEEKEEGVAKEEQKEEDEKKDEDNDDEHAQKPRWWIVHKSSSSEPFLVDLLNQIDNNAAP